MMPQKEVSETIYQQTDSDYARYEGQSPSSARHHVETPYERDWREGPSSKVYPLSNDRTNTLRFTLALIALGLVVLLGLLFIVVIGGPNGWPSFAVACIAILFIAGIGMDKIH